jgi:hypothetical protein
MRYTTSATNYYTSHLQEGINLIAERILTIGLAINLNVCPTGL